MGLGFSQSGINNLCKSIQLTNLTGSGLLWYSYVFSACNVLIYFLLTIILQHLGSAKVIKNVNYGGKKKEECGL